MKHLWWHDKLKAVMTSSPRQVICSASSFLQKLVYFLSFNTFSLSASSWVLSDQIKTFPVIYRCSHHCSLSCLIPSLRLILSLWTLGWFCVIVVVYYYICCCQSRTPNVTPAKSWLHRTYFAFVTYLLALDFFRSRQELFHQDWFFNLVHIEPGSVKACIHAVSIMDK